MRTASSKRRTWLGWSGRASGACLVAILAVSALVACDSIDPTAQSFAIRFENDLHRNVHLKLCSDDRCHDFNYSDGWKAGQSAEENISDRDLMTRWAVEDDATRTILGCLPLRFGQKYQDVIVRISQQIPCPGASPLTVQKGKGAGRS